MERANMIDGDPQTFWHTRFADGFAKPPHFVVLEVPEGTSVIRFTDGHCGVSPSTPTRYGLLTGRYSWRTWCKFSALSTSAPLLIEEDRVTSASFLKR